MTFIPSVVSKISTLNAVAAPITTPFNFTGTSESVQLYESITVTVQSNVDSVGSGLSLQFSTDGTFTAGQIEYINFTYLSGLTFVKTVLPLAQYFRLVYTAVGTQTTLIIQCTLNAVTQPVNTPQVIVPIAPLVDAFGRIRISNPYIVLEGNYLTASTITDTNISQTSLITGSGDRVLATNAPLLTLSVTAVSAGTAVQQTRRKAHYQPGRSLLVLMTGILNGSSNGTGSTTRIGYFNELDGIFFENQGDGTTQGVNRVVLRTSAITGTADDTKFVLQSNWNIDKLDGTGTSGFVFDASKTNIFVVDFEWLGVGEVRLGMFSDNMLIYCHKFYNSNIQTLPYMALPSLPCSYEVRSTAPVVASVVSICFAVISEGGLNPVGQTYSGFNLLTEVVTNTNVMLPVYAIAINTTTPAYGRYATVSLLNYFIGVVSNKVGEIFAYEIRIYRDQPITTVFAVGTTPTVTAGATGFTNSCINQFRAPIFNTTLSTSYETAVAAYGFSNVNPPSFSPTRDNIFITVNNLISGGPLSDIMVICAQAVAGSAIPDVVGSFQWNEVV